MTYTKNGVSVEITATEAIVRIPLLETPVTVEKSGNLKLTKDIWNLELTAEDGSSICLPKVAPVINMVSTNAKRAEKIVAQATALKADLVKKYGAVRAEALLASLK